MRYAKDHKEETRKRIIGVASQRFREEGIEKVGVAALMHDAHLTVGGFYSHFKSKEELVHEAIARAAEETYCKTFGGPDNAESLTLRQILTRYLSVEHRDAPASGCVVAALSSELLNRPEDTRAMVSDKIMEKIHRIADCLAEDVDMDTRMRVARSVWTIMVGTLQLSRLIPDNKMSVQILKDGIDNALALAGQTGMRQQK